VVLNLAVRVKLKIKTVKGKEMKANALVNTGFETDRPQLLIPVALAKELNLWPPIDAVEVTYDTAGGPTKLWLYNDVAYVKIVNNIESKEVLCDILISPIEHEVLISDYLAGSLEIIIENPRIGYWRLKSEPHGTIHESVKPQYWH